MRQKTRTELTKLANLMVKDYDVEVITLTSSDFITIAGEVIEDENLDINIQTVERWEQWLKNKVKDVQNEMYEEEVLKVFETDVQPKRELKRTIHFYSDGTYEVVKPERKPDVKSTDYTMFIETPNGLKVTRGTYVGRLVSDIDKNQWVGCAAGWAKYQLDKDSALGERIGGLTEDDKEVFKKIMRNEKV